MAKAKLQANGKWRLRSFIGTDSAGKKVFQSFTCDTEAQCYKEEKKWLKAGGGVIIEETPKGPTVDDLIDQYIDSCRNSKRKTYSPSTIATYEKIKRCNVGPLADREASTITIEDLQDLIDSMTNEGKAVKTMKGAVYLIEPALAKAGLMLPTKQLEYPDEEPEEYIIPTDEEIQMLLAATKESNHQLYQAIVLGAFCGCRRSEICALTHGDVNRSEMTLHVDKAVVLDENCVYQKKETKTRAGKRDIDIDQSILDAITITDLDGVLYAPNVPLVGLTPTQLSSRWNRLKEKLHIQFCFHALRHYHASVMVALDVPKKYAAAQMGHSTYDMIDKVYGQIIAAKEKTVAAAINDHAATVLGGKTYQW